MLVVIGTDCIDSHKSNYDTITTTTAPLFNIYEYLHVSSALNNIFLSLFVMYISTIVLILIMFISYPMKSALIKACDQMIC
jgi:hypothetical protein